MQVLDSQCANNTVVMMVINGISHILYDIGQSSRTVVAFVFIVNDEPPKVRCGFNKPQDVNYAGGNLLLIDYCNQREDLVEDFQF